MEKKPDIWVERRADGKWEVRHAGGRGIIGTWEQREDAISAGQDYARTADALLYVQGVDGNFHFYSTDKKPRP